MLNFNQHLKSAATGNFIGNVVINGIIAYFLNKGKLILPDSNLLFDLILTGFLLCFIIYPIVAIPAIKKVKNKQIGACKIEEISFYNCYFLSKIFYNTASKFNKNVWIAALEAGIFGIIVSLIIYAIILLVMTVFGMASFNLYPFVIFKAFFTGFLAVKVTYLAAPYILKRAE